MQAFHLPGGADKITLLSGRAGTTEAIDDRRR